MALYLNMAKRGWMDGINWDKTNVGLNYYFNREGGTTMSHEWEVVQANLFLKV